MGIRKELEKRIEKKRAEIADLKKQVELSESYLQAMLDTFRLIPKDEESGDSGKSLRPGTDLANAYLALEAAGQPLHVADLLKAMGKAATQQNKTSLTGSLGSYVRRGDTFTRPAPNTFGLKAFEAAPVVTDGGEQEGAIAH